MINRKFIVLSGVIFVGVCLLYFLLVILPRIGKVPVEILVHPNDSTITINGNRSASGIQYLSVGEYTVKAEKDGWIADEVKVSVSDEINQIALLPRPNSNEAREIAEEDNLEREGLAGVKANARGANIRSDYPIINKLPYSDIAGPYKIDYGFNRDDTTVPYLLISFTTPKSRQKALEWLQNNEVDLTTTEIIFSDFVNPIKNQEKFHG